MGRPRKRRREDEETEVQPEAFDSISSIQFEDVPEFGFDAPDFSSDFYPRQNQNLQSVPSALDVLGPNVLPNPELAFDPRLPIDPSLGLSGFGQTPPQWQSLSTSSTSNAQTLDTAPSSMDTSFPMAKCSCLSDLYLALSVLQGQTTFDFPYVLPTIHSVMRTTTGVLRCEQCPKEMSTAMQNIMLLATLLTSITDCYRKLLTSVDVEAKRADEAGEKKRFRMGDNSPELMHLHTNTVDCPMGFDVELDGQEWRTLARKVIKAGVEGSRTDPPTIMGMASMLEERQHQWHQNPDTLETRIHFGGDGKPCEPRDGEFSCLKMIMFVRRHVERLGL
jgi:hypothetical protein